MVGLKHSYLTAITYKECGNTIMSDACRILMILSFEQDYLSPIVLIIIIREQASIILFLL